MAKKTTHPHPKSQQLENLYKKTPKKAKGVEGNIGRILPAIPTMIKSKETNKST